jgi:5'-nucleotidase
MTATARVLFAILLASCGGASPPRAEPSEIARVEAATGPRTVTISVVGTNDLHGHVRALPVFAGYLHVLRELRVGDGALVLLDGGDMFQGTLESNLLEGAPVVDAYGALGYDAVAIGNHEFDYGPVGERATPAGPEDDPRGALRARARQARFPFLNANILAAATESRVDWDNVPASVLLEKGGVRIGVIGATTEEALRTTLFTNVLDLQMAPLVASIAREAASLRARGASVVLVTAHAGGVCTALSDPHDLSSCRPDEEIFEVARQLPAGAVDAIVAGHTHQAVAHFVNGIAIVESYCYGRAFGRVDLEVDADARRVVDVRIHPPTELCVEGSADGGDCVLGELEGRSVVPDPAIEAMLAPAIANAAEARERPLGVAVAAPIPTTRVRECPLGNLFTDLMRAARPEADVALTNGGGLRAPLPAGPLTYGQLYEATPFDNRFAFIQMTGADLSRVMADNLQRDGSFFSLSGIRAEARCDGSELRVRLSRDDGRRVRDTEVLSIVTTDYLATASDGLLGELAAAEGASRIEDAETVRDAMARALSTRGGSLRPESLYDPAHPRVRYEGTRPIACP